MSAGSGFPQRLQVVAEAKDRFLSRMSHEIRTPLNSVLGFAQLLKRSTLTPQQAEYVGHVHAGGQRLLTLVNEVLDLSRVRSGRLKVEVEAVDLAGVIDGVLTLMTPLAAERHVRFERAGETRVGARVDAHLLDQVLVNLCSNAVKFNVREGVVVVGVQRRDGGRVRVSVTDSGPGISDADQRRIFKPFERLDNARGVEGTGLGLVLTREFLAALGSELHLDSAPGRGSTFWFDLEAADV